MLLCVGGPLVSPFGWRQRTPNRGGFGDSKSASPRAPSPQIRRRKQDRPACYCWHHELTSSQHERETHAVCKYGQKSRRDPENGFNLASLSLSRGSLWEPSHGNTQVPKSCTLTNFCRTETLTFAIGRLRDCNDQQLHCCKPCFPMSASYAETLPTDDRILF